METVWVNGPVRHRDSGNKDWKVKEEMGRKEEAGAIPKQKVNVLH